MTPMKKTFLLLFFLPAFSHAQISPDSAKYYFDKQTEVEVCGKVIDVGMVAGVRDGKQFTGATLKFGNRQGTKKNIVFTATIPANEPFSSIAEHDKYWADLKKKYIDSTICVRGKIIAEYLDGYGKTPSIKVDSMANVRYK